MLRRIHTLFTLSCALLLLGVLALWWRSQDRTDTLVLRTAPSYVSGPLLKWVSLGTSDGLVLSLYTKIVPAISAPTGPRWRDDVTLATTAPGIQTAGEPTRLLGAMTPAIGGAALMSPSQLREYESLVQTDYSESAVLRHETGPAPFPARFRTGNWIVQRLGVWSFGPNLYEVYDEEYPGAYGVTRFRVPFALGATACAAAALPWVPGHLKRRRARRRLLRRLCPECGYDLRSSPVLCPECGHEVDDREERRARMKRTEALSEWLRRSDRPTVLARAGVIATAAAAVLVLRTNAGSTAESRRLRRELNRQITVVTDEVNRLRAAGDAVAADRLDAELQQATRQRDDGAGLHVVVVNETVYPGTTVPRRTPVEVTATGQPLVLALCGEDGREWDLRVAGRVRIEKVMLEGGTGQQVRGLPRGVPVEDHGAPDDRNFSRCVMLFGDDPDTRRSADIFFRHHTGLTPGTFQYRDYYRRTPFVVGPTSADWRARRALTRLQPAYVRATRFQRDRALAAVSDVRFTADWALTRGVSVRGGPAVPAPIGYADYIPYFERYTAWFDVLGPIRSSFLAIPRNVNAEHAQFERPIWVGLSNDGEWIGLDARTDSYFRIRTAAGDVLRAGLGGRIAGGAYDSRRRRLMTVDENGDIAIYPLDGSDVQRQAPLGSRQGYTSLTFSEHDDCFYALGSELTPRGATVMTITRVTPDGVAEWQIPVRERVAERGMGGTQVVAAGRFLAILTAVIPDPAAPEAWPSRRCVLIDPHTNTVAYSGPISPHGALAAPGKARPSHQ